jgi:hypothetical protein
MTDQTITRRNLIGAAATIAAAPAAAVALPAVTQAAPELKVPATCQLDAWDQLTATLTREQLELLIQIDADHGNGWLDEQRALVNELKRHAPAFAAMIELTYEHVSDQRVALRGRCCSGTPVEGEYRYI